MIGLNEFQDILLNIKEPSYFSGNNLKLKGLLFVGNRGTGKHFASKQLFLKLKNTKGYDYVNYLPFNITKLALENIDYYREALDKNIDILDNKCVCVVDCSWLHANKNIDQQKISMLTDFCRKAIEKKAILIVLSTPKDIRLINDKLFNLTVEFPDYTNEELVEILCYKVKIYRYAMRQSAEAIALRYFSSLPRQVNFTNAYQVELYLQRVIAHHSSVISSIDEMELSASTITTLGDESFRVAADNKKNHNANERSEITPQPNIPNNHVDETIQMLMKKVDDISIMLDSANKNIGIVDNRLQTLVNDNNSQQFDLIQISLNKINECCLEKTTLESLISDYNSQIRKFQSDLLLKTKLPLINDMINIADSLRNIVRDIESQPMTEQVESILARSIKPLIVSIKNNLNRQGVTEFCADHNTEFNPETQIEYSGSAVLTDDLNLDDLINETIHPGYYWQIPFVNAKVNSSNEEVNKYKEIIRNVIVSTYKYKK